MTTFKVRWEIDIEADTPREAAYIALQIQRNPDSIATVFECYATSGPGVSQQIDLSDPGPVPAYFSDTIETLEQAEAFLSQLHKDDKLFHLEDDPADIVKSINLDRLFTDEETDLLRERVAEVFVAFRSYKGTSGPYGGDPFQFIMDELLKIDAGDEA